MIELKQIVGQTRDGRTVAHDVDNILCDGQIIGQVGRDSRSAICFTIPGLSESITAEVQEAVRKRDDTTEDRKVANSPPIEEEKKRETLAESLIWTP